MKRGLTLLLLLALLCSGCRNMPETGYAYVESKPSPVAETAAPALVSVAGRNSAAQKTYLYEWNLLLPDAPKKYAFQWGSFTRADIEQLIILIRLRQWESMDSLLSAFEGGIWPDIEHTQYGADTELWVSFEQFEQANVAVLFVQEGGGQTLLLMFTVQGETYVPCCALAGRTFRYPSFWPCALTSRLAGCGAIQPEGSHGRRRLSRRAGRKTF